MRTIANIFLLPFKILMLPIACLLFLLQFASYFVKSIANIFLNTLIFIIGVFFIAQLLFFANTSFSMKVLLAILIMLVLKFILSFFTASFKAMNRFLGNCISFWF